MAMTKSAFAASQLAARSAGGSDSACQLRMIGVQSALARLCLGYRNSSVAGEAGISSFVASA